VTAPAAWTTSRCLDLVTAAFRDRLGGDARPAPLRRGEPAPASPASPAGLIARRTEQTHLLLGTRRWAGSTSRATPRPCSTPPSGGGMSSRLFQEIREKRGPGLQRRVGAHALRRAGAFSVYAGCSKKRVPEVLRLIRAELDRVAAEGISAEEVRTRPRPAQGRPGARARGHRVAHEPARQERALLRGVPAGARGARRLDAVDEEQVRAVAAELFSQETCLAVVGPYRESDLDHL
jgi:predicted Zn-dependent peptidase